LTVDTEPLEQCPCCCVVYLWADGIHVQARLEDAAQCLLVIIGAAPEGKK
jgi:transposase-like protein